MMKIFDRHSIKLDANDLNNICFGEDKEHTIIFTPSADAKTAFSDLYNPVSKPHQFPDQLHGLLA